MPKNEARIRFSLNAAIPEEDYDCLMEFIEISLIILDFMILDFKFQPHKSRIPNLKLVTLPR